MFKYTDKQKKLFEVLKNTIKRFFLIDGGSRSGKTVGIARWFILRRIKYPQTRSLIARQSKTSCKNSVWKQTLLPLLESDFKGKYVEDKSNNIIKFHNGSEIWLGGFDNKQHADDVLGQEWADIWVNEGTDTHYEIFGKLKSRLNVDPKYKEEHNFSSKFIIDCNPKGNGHWLNKLFNKGIDPLTGNKASADLLKNIDRLGFHPLDNRENLDPDYIRDLELLAGLNRKRFWEGIWADQVDNAVYRFSRVINVVQEVPQYDQRYETWCSFDFGISDPTSIIWYQVIPTPENRRGYFINIIDEYETNNQPVEHYVNIINAKPYISVNYCGDPSGANRNESLNSWISRFKDFGIHIKTKYGHSLNELIDNANEWIECVRINDFKCPKTVEMFENWELEQDRDNKPREGKPTHSKYSHLGTSFYYFIINRFPIKKKTVIQFN